jgi:hypothetical protein
MSATAPPQGRWQDAPPCGCWSCDSQCGGTSHPTSCGPLDEVDGQKLCQACRKQAQVFGLGDRRPGVHLARTDSGVEMVADVFNTFGKARVELSPASARHLAALLTEMAGPA